MNSGGDAKNDLESEQADKSAEKVVREIKERLGIQSRSESSDVDSPSIDSESTDGPDQALVESSASTDAGLARIAESSLPDPDESTFFDSPDVERDPTPQLNQAVPPRPDISAEPINPIVNTTPAKPSGQGGQASLSEDGESEHRDIDEVARQWSETGRFLTPTDPIEHDDLSAEQAQTERFVEAGDQAQGSELSFETERYVTSANETQVNNLSGERAETQQFETSGDATQVRDVSAERAKTQRLAAPANAAQVSTTGEPLVQTERLAAPAETAKRTLMPAKPKPRASQRYRSGESVLAPVAQPRSPKKKAGKAGVLTALLAPFVALGCLLALWWFLTRGADPILNDGRLATPSDTLDTFRDFSNDNSFRESIIRTAGRIGLALAGGALVGIALGWLTGRFTLLRNLSRPVVAFFRLLSPILLVPFFLLWFASDELALWLPALIGMVAMMTWSMSNAIDDQQRNMAFNIGERLILAMRNGLAVAWPLVFAAEMLSGEDGVGTQLLAQRDASRIDGMIVWLVVALVMAIVADLILRLVQFLLARRARRVLV